MLKDAGEYYEIIERAKNGEDGYYLITIDNIGVTGSSTSGGDPTEYRLSGSNNAYFRAYTEVRKNGVNYYYLVFSFRDSNGNYLSGETYSCYSQAAVKGLSDITFAYTKEYDGDGSWDIMPINYKLKDNMDYANANKNVFAGLALFLAGGGLFVLFIFLSIKLSKKDKVPSTATTKSTETTYKKPERTHVYKECVYCGAQLTINSATCPSCGSKRFEVKTKVLKD